MDWIYGIDQEDIEIVSVYGSPDVFYGFEMEDPSKRHEYGGDYSQSVLTLSVKQSIQLCALMMFEGYARIQLPEDETDPHQVVRCQSIIEELKTLFIGRDEYKKIKNSCFYSRYDCTLEDLREHDNPDNAISCIDWIVTDLKLSADRHVEYLKTDGVDNKYFTVEELIEQTKSNLDRDVAYYNGLRDLISQRREILGDSQ